MHMSVFDGPLKPKIDPAQFSVGPLDSYFSSPGPDLTSGTTPGSGLDLCLKKQ